MNDQEELDNRSRATEPNDHEITQEHSSQPNAKIDDKKDSPEMKI